jgi:hypothetical protein
MAPRSQTASLARALRLTRDLVVTVTIDESGWLKDNVELRYQRERGGTIQPVLVRVGHEALDADVLAEGGVLARCRAYNNALDQLRQLALRLGALATEQRERRSRPQARVETITRLRGNPTAHAAIAASSNAGNFRSIRVTRPALVVIARTRESMIASRQEGR